MQLSSRYSSATKNGTKAMTSAARVVVTDHDLVAVSCSRFASALRSSNTGAALCYALPFHNYPLRESARYIRLGACFALEDHFGMGLHASGKSFRISNLTILASARDEPLA